MEEEDAANPVKWVLPLDQSFRAKFAEIKGVLKTSVHIQKDDK